MHCPHPRGITVLPVPVPTYYRGVCPHRRGITVNFVPITAHLPRLPRFFRCPHPHAALYCEYSLLELCSANVRTLL